MYVLTDRQGGHATNWSTTGTTDYEVGLSRLQVGSISITEDGVVTFPEAFAGNPLVFARVETALPLFATVSNISTTQATIHVWNDEGREYETAVTVHWRAVGPT